MSRLKCDECGSEQTEVRPHPAAFLGGLVYNGVPNMEIYCFSCTASYCRSVKEIQNKTGIRIVGPSRRAGSSVLGIAIIVLLLSWGWAGIELLKAFR